MGSAAATNPSPVCRYLLPCGTAGTCCHITSTCGGSVLPAPNYPDTPVRAVLAMLEAGCCGTILYQYCSTADLYSTAVAVLLQYCSGSTVGAAAVLLVP